MARVIWKSSKRSGLAAILTLIAASPAWAQQVPSSAVLAPGNGSSSAVTGASHSVKQQMLADQAQRLVVMATELKVDVDKTNKNILSLEVVRKAEEIETLARRMKDQGKK